jgi:hypothetical protein
MAGSKHVRLSNRPREQRAGERTAVTLDGKCRAGEREIQDVLVLDLGQHGCRLLGVSVGVTKSDPLQLWLGDAGPFAARLKWAKRGSLGVEFDEPLDEHVLERLAGEDSRPNVVPMRRSRAE